MRRFFVLIGFYLSLLIPVFSQDYDDRFVTSGLQVNTSSEKFIAYMKQLEEGMAKVENGAITSNDQIVMEYGIDLLDYPRISTVVATANWTAYGDEYTPGFLRGIYNIIERSASGYENVLKMRADLRRLGSTGLNESEAEALAAIDITIQKVARKYVTSLSGMGFKHGNLNNLSISLLYPFCDYNHLKLPGWFRCVFGVITEAIFGGFSGVRVGSIIGGPLGAVIVGIVGVVGGTFSGVLKYCQ